MMQKKENKTVDVPENLEVLWLDDDCPPKVDLEGVNVHCVKSCQEAENVLESGVQPDWVVVDLIVPQDGWQSTFFKVPGIAYLRHLTKNRSGIKTAAYSIFLDDERAKRVKEAGADAAFVKTNFSFPQVVEELRSIDQGRGI